MSIRTVFVNPVTVVSSEQYILSLVVKSAAAAGEGGGSSKTGEGQEQHSTTSVSSSQGDENIDPEECEEMEIDETAMNYDFAMKEVILNELNSGKL